MYWTPNSATNPKLWNSRTSCAVPISSFTRPILRRDPLNNGEEVFHLLYGRVETILSLKEEEERVRQVAKRRGLTPGIDN